MRTDKNTSVWEKDTERKSFPSLEGNTSADVLIIGGGIAGILCAYKLKKAGVNCILVEAKEILSGITKNTTAKITIAHGLIYDKLIRRFGENKARLYLSAQTEACEEYRRLAEVYPCDYEVRDSFVYTLGNKRKIERELTALGRLGVNAEHSDAPELPFSVAGAVRVGEQAQFNPLKLLFSLSEGLSIFEHTKVVQLMPNKAVTDKGEISFKRVIVATHFPILNKHGLYPLKLYQHRSYVRALEGAKTLHGMYVDASDTGLSLRDCGELLLLGGGGHRTGKRGGCWQELEDIAEKYYKGARIVGRWAAQDCMTLDGVAYIGRYSKRTPDVFVATGFNKWGITNSLVAANILTDLVRDKDNPYAEVFSPSRTILRPQLAINALESLLGLITPTVPRCPHLGCALRFNPAEHSWDCPCHGSRFAENGELIDNPATDDKRL